MNRIETERLILRDWKLEDLTPFSKMNQEPAVIEFLLPSTEEETATLVEAFQKNIEENGFSFFACELKSTNEFIGFIGVKKVPFYPHGIEIGWRLAKEYWGKGYATEGARAVLHKSFTDYGFDELVSFTVRENVRSRRVMEKIGFAQDENGDFQHPRLPKKHPLSWHVLYRLTKEDYFNSYVKGDSNGKHHS